MRLSQLLISTLREDPADAEIPSHKLLARGAAQAVRTQWHWLVGAA
jgi:prolyl-tRNA synthetase